MTGPEITFGDVELDGRRRADVRGALRRIRSGSEPGAWPSRVDHIEVTGVLAGGRSGALVLDIVVYSGNARLARVAKIDSPSELAAEWRSYHELIKPDTTIYFAPIVAATQDVEAPPDADWGPGAVVYDHARQFTGGQGEPPRSLEDLVRAARTGSAEHLHHVLRIIRKLLRGAASVLYDRRAEHEAYPSTLRPMNLVLGPNVVLSIDEHDPAPGGAVRLPDDVLLSRTVGGPRTAQLVAGETIVLANLRPDPRGRPGFARGDDIDVVIRPAKTRPPVFAVQGQVVQTRGATVRARMVAALEELGPVDPSDDGWVAAGTELGCPFGMLLDVLTRPARGRVRSVVHGDLNPRNILVVEGQPILIDYAHTAADQPQQSDFCWLELGLLREVFADLGFPEVLALQRWLALASRVLDHAWETDAVSVLAGLVTRRAPELVVPFQVLLTIRRCGRHPRPNGEGLPWHQDYLEQLLLAAHRAAKWADEDQTPARLRATVAAAAVATEHLGVADGFTRWADADLAAAIAGVAPILRFTDDGAIHLVRDLAAAMSTVDGATEAVLTAVRERVVRARCEEHVRSLRDEWTGHAGYVDLTAAARGSDVDDVFAHIAAVPAAVLCGASGSGKTTVLREAGHRLAVAVLDLPTFDADDPGSLPVRLPVLLDAERLAGLCAADDDPVTVAAAVLGDSGLDGVTEPALALGVPYLLIDDLDRLGADARRAVLSWLSGLRLRYPRVHVLAAQRQPSLPTEFASVVLTLRDLDVAGMRALLHGALAGTTVRGTTVERLLGILLTEPEWQQVHPRRPGVLTTVARLVDRTDMPNGVFAPGDILAEQWLGTSIAGAPKVEDLELICERIAVRSIEERTDTVALKSLSWPEIEDPDGLLDHLAGRGVLRWSHGEAGFPDQAHRNHFAACALRRNLPTAPVDLVRRLHWHAALRVFVTLPGVADARDVVLGLVRAACRTAPKLAAQLINDARIDDEEIVTRFVSSCLEALTSDYSVAHETGEAADALSTLTGSAGLDALRSVVADAACRPDIRVAALRAIAAHLRRSALGGRQWAGEIARLLAEPCPVPLRVAALEVIAADGLRGLELHVGRCVASTEPWPVVRAAVTTLRALGIALPVPWTDVVQVACRQRLAEVAQALNAAIVPAEASRYRTERAELLAMLSGPDAVATLLAHRFDFLVGHRPAAALDDVARLGPSPDPPPAYWDILLGDTAPDVWVRTTVAGEPLDAAAAAHRLLRDAPDHAVHALARIDATAPPYRLLIAAAVLRATGASGLNHAERLFHDVMDIVDEDRITGAAALLCAICSVRPESGVRLAWSTAELLAERDVAARHRWPWVAALARCRGGVAELSNLIEASDDTAVLAEAALASRDFPRHCHTGRLLSFGPSARQRMLDRAPDEDSADREAARWALAAANMDLVEALPTLRALVTRMTDAPVVATIGTVRSGQTSWTPLADVLAVLGYLARRAFDLRTTEVRVDRELDEVHRLVSDLEARDAHHSVRTGRVIALAYLGDCAPLAQAIIADPSLYELGHNALTAWAPYPHTPRSLRTEAALAEWLAGLRDRPALPADARQALTRLTRVAELRSGVLFPQGEPDMSGKPHEHMC